MNVNRYVKITSRLINYKSLVAKANGALNFDSRRLITYIYVSFLLDFKIYIFFFFYSFVTGIRSYLIKLEASNGVNMNYAKTVFEHEICTWNVEICTLRKGVNNNLFQRSLNLLIESFKHDFKYDWKQNGCSKCEWSIVFKQFININK